ncbi:MAG: hypothetical protein Q8O86_09545 [Dehalococcoidia bacterium]|nr:hypothetical protein [Dehalococcoidia bacterium]
MKLAWLGALFFVAAVVMDCSSSPVPPAREALLQPTPTQVPGIAPTASPFSPPTQAAPASTSTPVPVLTPTATPFSTLTPSQPSPTATSAPAPASPAAVPTQARPSPTTMTVPASSAAGSPSAPQGAGDDQPGVPSSSLAAGEKSLAVIQKGDWKFIKNGGRVNLPNGLSAELFLDPYPLTRLTAKLDVNLTRRGQPVSNASVSAAYDMKGMAHGPFNSQTKNLGNSHYLFTMDYIEFGSWEHKLVIYLPEDHYELAVGVVVSP